MDRAAKLRRDALDFVDRLEQRNDLDSVVDAMGAMLRDCGIDHFCMSFLPSSRKQKLKDVLLIDRLPAGMLDHYRREGYLHCDPALRHCWSVCRPFRWMKEAPYNPEREPRFAEVANGCREFIKDGFVVPVVTLAGRMGQVFFGGDDILLPDIDLTILHFMALYAFDRVTQLHGLPVTPQTALTLREREVMTRHSQGMTDDEIGEVLHISARTVTQHMVHVRQKFEVPTRAQALTISIRDRHIRTS